MLEAHLFEIRNFWDHILDFNWHRQDKSPNWETMTTESDTIVIGWYLKVKFSKVIFINYHIIVLEILYLLILIWDEAWARNGSSSIISIYGFIIIVGACIVVFTLFPDPMWDLLPILSNCWWNVRLLML